MVSAVVLGRSAIMLKAARALAEAGVSVVGVITADAYAEYDVGPADFAAFAEEVGAQFALATTSAEIEAMNFPTPDGDTPVLISCNWRYKLSESLLARWTNGVLNLHLGNLPDYKGNATVNWSILDGLDHIYANVHRMVAELDAGDVLVRRRIEITDTTYVGDVLAEAEDAAGALFIEALDALRDGSTPLVTGTTKGLRCFPRLPEDGRIDWTQSAADIGRLVRASSRPYPGAFCFSGPTQVQVWRARPASSDCRDIRAVPGHIIQVDRSARSVVVACGSGALEITEISANGALVAPTDIARGIRARFSSTPDAVPSPLATRPTRSPAAAQ